MDKVQKIALKDYYLAYFDILGYKDFIKNKNIDNKEFLQNIIDIISGVRNDLSANNGDYLSNKQIEEKL